MIKGVILAQTDNRSCHQSKPRLKIKCVVSPALTENNVYHHLSTTAAKEPQNIWSQHPGVEVGGAKVDFVPSSHPPQLIRRSGGTS